MKAQSILQYTLYASSSAKFQYLRTQVQRKVKISRSLHELNQILNQHMLVAHHLIIHHRHRDSSQNKTKRQK